MVSGISEGPGAVRMSKEGEERKISLLFSQKENIG